MLQKTALGGFLRRVEQAARCNTNRKSLAICSRGSYAGSIMQHPNDNLTCRVQHRPQSEARVPHASQALTQSVTLSDIGSLRRPSGIHSPDDEGLVRIALRGEGDDVVGALQLRKGVVLCIPPQLHAAGAPPAVHHACARPGQVLKKMKFSGSGSG